MNVLNIEYNDYEKNVLYRFCKNDYEILSEVKGNIYILNDDGEYFYNECFNKTENNYLMNQKYEKATAFRMIKFYNDYIMESKEERGIWYRGRKDDGGNFEFECYFDNLEEAFSSL